MDSDTDSSSSSSEAGDDPWEEAGDLLMEIMNNAVPGPDQMFEVDLGNRGRLVTSIHVRENVQRDAGVHVNDDDLQRDADVQVNEVTIDFNWMGNLQQLLGLLGGDHRGGVRHGGVRQGRVERRDHLRQGRARLELCRRCGKIHRAGACTGSRPVAAVGKLRNRQRACPICLEAMGAAGGDDVVLRCGHKFHYNCVAPWCRRRSTCPVCRSRLDQPS